MKIMKEFSAACEKMMEGLKPLRFSHTPDRMMASKDGEYVSWIMHTEVIERLRSQIKEL